MKIVIIHGQNHKGISYHIGHKVLNEFPQAIVNEFFLPIDMPHFCTGCCRCMNEGFASCPHYIAMKPILSAFEESDLFIFTTPVYCMHTSGSMKAFLDHCFVYWTIHRPQSYMYKKKAIIISVGAGGGMKRAVKDIKDSLEGWGISKIHMIAQRGMATSWESISDKTRGAIDKKVEKTIIKIQRNTRVSIKCKVMFYAMRFMHKKGMSASELDIQYWKEQGWIEDKRPWK